MKCLLFGASRGCGLEAAFELLTSGHDVTLFLRNVNVIESHPRVQSLPVDQRSRLHTVKGDAFVKEDVEGAFDSIGSDLGTVLFSIGGKPSFANPLAPKLEPAEVCERGIGVVLPVLKAYGEEYGVQPRLVVVSSSGLGTVGHAELPLIMKPMYSWLLKEPHADKEKLEAHVYHAAGLTHPDATIDQSTQTSLHTQSLPQPGWLKEFVIVRPAFLTDGPCTQNYRADEHLKTYTISRADIGHFIGKACVGEGCTWVNKAVTVGY
ncbi:hypothetical protein SpCBS45565_g02412 [Spizellomyces sp. 'palustris']|nr:hypothetical protein SpCBS45565_g02412 [Spizellomyces sp. 'palustris']